MISLKGWSYAVPVPVETPDECKWYHTMDLPQFGTQFGDWDLRGRWADYTGGVDVRGKSVLDVGTANGWVTFEAERHGAGEVLALDAADPTRFQRVPHRNCPPDERPEYFAEPFERWKRGFWLAHKLYDSKAKAVYGDVYELAEHVTGADVVIVGQILVHLRDALGALLQCARVAGETLVIVEGSFEADRPLAVFVGGGAGTENQYSWFHFSSGLYRDYLSILGFRVTSVSRHTYHCLSARCETEVWTTVATRFAPTPAD